MALGTDAFAGISLIITSIGTLIGVLVTAYITVKKVNEVQDNQAANSAKIDDLHDEVKTSNGHTLGQLMEDTAKKVSE